MVCQLLMSTILLNSKRKAGQLRYDPHSTEAGTGSSKMVSNLGVHRI